jgi:hypothetical protein
MFYDWCEIERMFCSEPVSRCNKVNRICVWATMANRKDEVSFDKEVSVVVLILVIVVASLSVQDQ